VQGPHERDHHDPPRLSALAAAALAAIVLAGAADAAAGIASLPSPVAPLSPSPPLGAGATASAENVPHRISAQTVVRISVDQSGDPFAVTATQRLDVRVLGDYFFTIGAPLVDVEATPGSNEVPGLRSDAIVWAGFNPLRRVLAARATLETTRVEASLPLRIETTSHSVTLVNATRTVVSAYAADARRGPLLAYARQLRADVLSGRAPSSGSAELISKPTAARITVVAPLRVVGTVAGRKVSLILRDRLVVHDSGPVDLRVTPVADVAVPTETLDGRDLLQAVELAALTVARTRQYDTFLGNPDPTGHSETTYVYRTATKIAPARPASVASARHDWERTALVFVGIALATVAGLAAWARS
jgi:hypothetical protein